MLELKNISKVYELGKKNTKDYQQVDALKEVSIKFREHEFVSILGASGCGKTTLLNIIGGLDKYTSGDLIINGKSTKEFKDKDWDTYRNHSVGFVFQSYNLIPHQTVLQNVELALTLSGISRDERRARAKEALVRVGLEDKINAKPNQLSGGQMQRVAIARALVNNPDVILADEPTGALDSKTSVQIIDLLKEISEEKLVVMVTHNPELAETYSTRIIRLKDGELVDDTNPVGEDEIIPVRENNMKRKSMSFFSALNLSFKNLLTKKARTILVSFAGSIGIIGIALILALSTGFQMYINRVQEDTLSNAPITISTESMDYMGLMMNMFMPESSDVERDENYVYSGDSMTGLFDSFAKSIQKNDLKSFKKYIEEHYDDVKTHVNDIQYNYALNFDVKQKDGTNVDPGSTSLYDMMIRYSVRYLEENAEVDVESSGTGYNITSTPDTKYDFVEQYLDNTTAEKLISDGTVFIEETKVVQVIAKLIGLVDEKTIMAYNTPAVSYGIFKEMINNPELLETQYKLLGEGSRWASSANEVMLVLDENNQIDDYILYSLGLITKEQAEQSIENTFLENKVATKIDYSSIIGKEYKIMISSDYFVDDGGDLVSIKQELYPGSGIYHVPESNMDKYNSLITDDNVGTVVKIVGICKLREEITAGSLSSGIAYTKALTDSLIERHNGSAAVEAGKDKEISLTPTQMHIYPKSFESRRVVINFIENYNKNVSDNSKAISYTDAVGIMVDSISIIISAISYILIGFVSVSLVVSSIMIGIITYISVLERIKEIGILRAVGASKRDIKRVFTAETFIIGLASGLIGIGVTLVLTIPINIIIKALTGIGGVAVLPWVSGVILVLISMILTIIAGLIPARIASKKDPVIALRSE